MKAVLYEKYGPPEVLRVEEIEKPLPGPGEVLIKIHAATVTRGDVRMRGFIVPPLQWLPSRIVLGIFSPKRKIPGMECSGIIESVGPKVSAFKPGDRVFASTFPGLQFSAYAEYVALSENGIIAEMPGQLTFEEAAVVPSGGCAALNFMRKGEIREGDRVMINGASGTLGTYGIQLAKHFGAGEICGVCSPTNRDLAQSLGADRIIDYTSEDPLRRENSYDVIYDFIGNLPKGKAKAALKPGGRFVSIRGKHREITNEDLLFLKKLIENGELRPVIDRIYQMEDIIEAHRYVEQGHKKGNVAVSIAARPEKTKK